MIKYLRMLSFAIGILISFAIISGVVIFLDSPNEADAAPAWRVHVIAPSGVTYVVTNTNDSGVGSLRQAILNANGNPGADTIEFNILSIPPLLQVFTIVPLTSLPTITDPVTIDGTTEEGTGHQPCHIALSHPCIVLNGSHATLHIIAGSSNVKGLVIHGAVTGISLETNGGNHITGNYIGTNVTGTGIISNQVGISIYDSPDNVIGGTSVAERNLISGNIVGIKINDMGSSASGNQILGNYIGLNAAGTAALGNNVGVELVDAGGNTIGGPAAGDGNVISGNSTGIVLVDSGGSGGNTFNNVIQGNYIGTDYTGMLAVSNLSYGVGLSGDVRNTMIRDNLISGNAGSGVLIVGATFSPSSNSIQNNHIGTTVNGIEALPNSSAGVGIESGARDNTIQGNVIAFNGSNGVAVGKTVSDTAQRNSIRNNSIYSNTLLGIDLGGNGVTPNDVGDADAGPNGLQNYPALSLAVSLGGNLSVAGILTSTSNTALTVEFFANRGCDASGHGEGESFIGSLPVATDSNGNASFNTILFDPVPAGQFVTATATDSSGNTSEFSQCVEAAPSINVYLPLVMR